MGSSILNSASADIVKNLQGVFKCLGHLYDLTFLHVHKAGLLLPDIANFMKKKIGNMDNTMKSSNFDACFIITVCPFGNDMFPGKIITIKGKSHYHKINRKGIELEEVLAAYKNIAEIGLGINAKKNFFFNLPTLPRRGQKECTECLVYANFKKFRELHKELSNLKLERYDIFYTYNFAGFLEETYKYRKNFTLTKFTLLFNLFFGENQILGKDQIHPKPKVFKSILNNFFMHGLFKQHLQICSDKIEEKTNDFLQNNEFQEILEKCINKKEYYLCAQ